MAAATKPLMPVPVWGQAEDMMMMSPLKFRNLHRKLQKNKQRLEGCKASLDVHGIENEELARTKHASNMRRSRLRYMEEAERDKKRGNTRLIERICAVVRDSELRQKQIATPHPPSTAPPQGTLNTGLRRKVAAKIDQDNRALLDRLERTGPCVVSKTEHVSKYQVYKDLRGRISRIRRPLVDLTRIEPPPRMEPRDPPPQPWRKPRLPPMRSSSPEGGRGSGEGAALSSSAGFAESAAATKDSMLRSTGRGLETTRSWPYRPLWNNAFRGATPARYGAIAGHVGTLGASHAANEMANTQSPASAAVARTCSPASASPRLGSRSGHHGGQSRASTQPRRPPLSAPEKAVTSRSAAQCRANAASGTSGGGVGSGGLAQGSKDAGGCSALASVGEEPKAQLLADPPGEQEDEEDYVFEPDDAAETNVGVAAEAPVMGDFAPGDATSDAEEEDDLAADEPFEATAADEPFEATAPDEPFEVSAEQGSSAAARSRPSSRAAAEATLIASTALASCEPASAVAGVDGDGPPSDSGGEVQAAEFEADPGCAKVQYVREMATSKEEVASISHCVVGHLYGLCAAPKGESREASLAEQHMPQGAEAAIGQAFGELPEAGPRCDHQWQAPQVPSSTDHLLPASQDQLTMSRGGREQLGEECSRALPITTGAEIPATLTEEGDHAEMEGGHSGPAEASPLSAIQGQGAETDEPKASAVVEQADEQDLQQLGPQPSPATETAALGSQPDALHASEDVAASAEDEERPVTAGAAISSMAATSMAATHSSMAYDEDFETHADAASPELDATAGDLGDGPENLDMTLTAGAVCLAEQAGQTLQLDHAELGKSPEEESATLPHDHAISAPQQLEEESATLPQAEATEGVEEEEPSFYEDDDHGEDTESVAAAAKRVGDQPGEAEGSYSYDNEFEQSSEAGRSPARGSSLKDYSRSLGRESGGSGRTHTSGGAPGSAAPSGGSGGSGSRGLVGIGPAARTSAEIPGASSAVRAPAPGSSRSSGSGSRSWDASAQQAGKPTATRTAAHSSDEDPYPYEGSSDGFENFSDTSAAEAKLPEAGPAPNSRPQGVTSASQPSGGFVGLAKVSANAAGSASPPSSSEPRQGSGGSYSVDEEHFKEEAAGADASSDEEASPANRRGVASYSSVDFEASDHGDDGSRSRDEGSYADDNSEDLFEEEGDSEA